MYFAFFVICSYLLGSINPSIIQGRARGINIRKEGSGNAGATNCLRIMGRKTALISLTCDVLKGLAAVSLGFLVSRECAYCCALSCFFGSIFPLYYQFKGGKGVACCLGIMLAISWQSALSALSIVILVVLVTRMVSAGSVLGSLSLPPLIYFFKNDFLPAALVFAFLIVIGHRKNIERIFRGTESRIRL